MNKLDKWDYIFMTFLSIVLVITITVVVGKPFETPEQRTAANETVQNSYKIDNVHIRKISHLAYGSYSVSISYYKNHKLKVIKPDLKFSGTSISKFRYRRIRNGDAPHIVFTKYKQTDNLKYMTVFVNKNQFRKLDWLLGR